MSYPTSCYNQVLNHLTERFNLKDVAPGQWIIWRHHIKTLFDQDILIKEILAAVDEAAEKGKWPQGTGFFSRVRDIVLVHRKQTERVVTVDRGFTSLGEIL